ncbi:hypothetical protein FBU59_002750 [Linderina macrospora]|uniref:Uncharacterized protein n=1 Tax=Linderina macrospora TaxID=4868 RepID=A0ACC1JAB3_9FUNG|nr:hypothetical protein FBU59_002750 [Linderina macrospora]
MSEPLPLHRLSRPQDGYQGAVSGKRAPPPPPTSRKPQTKPKPPGLMSNRHSSTSPSPSPSSVPSTADLRSTLRPAAATTQNTPRASAIMQPRNSQDDGTDSGIIAESQGSVSSLAGIFGKSVRSKGANHSRSLTETMFNRTESPPAPARPPVPPSAAFGDRFSHQRTGSGSAPPHPPPPPPPQSAGAGANGTASVPVREGKWSFHSMSDLPQPPQMSISRHKYPSGNATGSAIALDI